MNQKDACQKNVLNILGALYLIETKYLRKITIGLEQPDIPDNVSKLFSLDNWNYRYIPLNKAMALIDNEITVLDE